MSNLIGNRINDDLKKNLVNVSEAYHTNKNNSLKQPIIFLPEKPKYELTDLILPDAIKDQIFDILSYKETSEIVFNKWGLAKTHKYSKKIGINLYGEPGTGKTMAAHAIANYLSRDIIAINYADIESKYVGETSKNLVLAFKTAKETNAILFFDEADAILSKRVTNMSHATDVSVNQTRSVMLMLLNDYEDIILFATNFIQNFDPAFMRRILAHIKFELPDLACRKRLWEQLIPKELLTDLDINSIAEKYEGISGSDISNAILMAAFRGARTDEYPIPSRFFTEAIESIIASKQANKSYQNINVTDRIVTNDYVKQHMG